MIGIILIIVLLLFGVFMVWGFIAILKESWRYAKKINRLVDITLDDDRLAAEERKIKSL